MLSGFRKPLAFRIRCSGTLTTLYSQKVQDLKLLTILNVASGIIERFPEYACLDDVRKLANVVEREIILNPYGPLTFAHVTLAIQPKLQDIEYQHEKTDKLDDVIRQHIQRALAKTGGKGHGLGGAAELLGVNANTLRDRLNTLDMAYGRKRKSTKAVSKLEQTL